jgi:DNA-binding transcriptional MerR regulator
MTHDDVEQAVQRVVALRRVTHAVLDPEERRRLERVIHELRQEIGIGVPKRRAARLLGVSVQALQPWIERGLLPAVRKPGSTRELLDAETLIVLAEEVTRRREAGESRGVVAGSLRELERTSRLPRKLRPNQTARELRREFLATTPQGRLRDVAALSQTAVALAAAGAEARKRRGNPS